MPPLMPGYTFADTRTRRPFSQTATATDAKTRSGVAKRSMGRTRGMQWAQRSSLRTGFRFRAATLHAQLTRPARAAAIEVINEERRHHQDGARGRRKF